jgi:hypothetical protein
VKVPPNKHINLTRWEAEIDSMAVARRLCAGRSTQQRWNARHLR